MKKNVLIIGPCNSVKSNKNKIIRFIKKYKPIVLILNAINPIQKKYSRLNQIQTFL